MALPPEAHDELLTPAGVAALLHVTPKTVTRWAEAGRLAVIRTPGGHRRYLRSEVLAIVSGLHPDHGDAIHIPPVRAGPLAGAAIDGDAEHQAAAAAVVAEAVALALEAVAAEAAEAVLRTTAAVAEAAQRAADAAETARGARVFAAEAAAQSVARESRRRAARVRMRADVAAVQVHDAAVLAAEELARSVEAGTALDHARLAMLLETTVRLAAGATAQDTTRAATEVRDADSAAAAQVVQRAAAFEQVVAREFTATADAQRELATATAMEVALETEARAAGVEIAAREVAALLTDEQWARTVERRDITEQHRLEIAQDSFYTHFEHDFRLPITAIKGFAELMRDADPAYREHLIQRIESNADRLLTMGGELVDYARPRSGLDTINLRVVDMAALARRAVANISSIADTSRVQVTSAAPVEVTADPAALERAIANLVLNALKYSPTASDVTLVGERADGTGVLRIIDRGRGIDERDLGSIFLDFERGRVAQDDGGTGIGLASVQRLIGLQRGTVTITSRVQVGTTVTIHLPLAPGPGPGPEPGTVSLPE
ncbi:hypothetical protein BH09ACT12_BH09ACT12_22500 [soil metagenome]